MKKFLAVVFLTGIMVFGATQAKAVIIDFEGGANGTAVGSDYVGLGVVFDNAFYSTSPYSSENGSRTWVSGETDGEYNGVGNIAITGHFTGVTDFLSAQIIYADWLSTTSYLSVYDTGGILINQVSLSSDTTPYTVSVSNSGIASFAFHWIGGASSNGGLFFDDVIGIDNLQFNSVSSVPEPSALLLLGSGLIGLAGLRKMLLV